ncbi:rubrerythrin [Desulfosporosinus sp. HMP52]|uniref:ferritin-like domain-containing protein n=1 Tax=Desulfosporosinus sp. HMP52 TaxID=1487923 RepID=UPI00051FB65E|nr:ferritin family protein [Desulfosporosinus sp. HMP52]KGK85496.1 rubrerythrin [Desulfosporosinus sp. HMP52]
MNIFEFAIKMEIDGENYYKEQAEINKDNSLNTVFLMLAKDEKIHARVLQQKANQQAYDLSENETLSEAKNIFKNMEFKQTPDQLRVYRSALQNEQDSIDLYRTYLSEVTDDESKQLFEYLIKQEEDHYIILEELVLLVSRAEEWVESAEFGTREQY